MDRRTLTRLAAVAVGGALALTGCGNGDSDGDDAGDDALRVGLAYDIGGRGDKSYNDAAYAGLQRIQEEMDLEVNDIDAAEGETDADKISRLELMADEGYDPIIAVGFAYAPAVAEVAANYPDVRFAIVDEDMDAFLEQQAEQGEEVEDLNNVTSLLFAEEQASFLVGAAAALKTEEDHVGFIGGVETPLIAKFEAGFIAGVEHINPDVEVESAYISQPPDFSGFQDTARGKSIAEGQYDEGADIIYHAAGAAGIGVLEAAAERELMFIGVDSDQYESAPEDQAEYVVTSAIKRVDTAVFEFVQSVADGTVEPEPVRFDLANDGVDYATSNEEQISDIQDELDEIRQQIIDGEIEVPDSLEEE